MLKKPVDHKLLNNFTWLLRERGIWVERHSYSFRIMYNNLIIGSLHIYPGFNEAVLRIHSIDKNSVEYIVNNVKKLFNQLFPEYRLIVHTPLD